MLIRNFMTKQVITIDAEDAMPKAIQMLQKHKINMMPVLHNGKVVGVISDRDLKKASPSDATDLEKHELKYLLNKIKIKEIMTKKVISVPPDFTIEETAEVLLNHDISGAPVLDGKGNLVGIITNSDLYKALISLSGLGRRGIHFAFQVEDRPGTIKELTDVIRTAGGRIASIMSSYDRVREGWRNVFIRVYDIDRERLPQLVQDLQQRGNMLYLVDHKENRREIFSAPAPAAFSVGGD
ncbi:MAG: CBS and ACT domain-containing protein [Desulfobacca sp.]|uniref:CBS and ACT domain-containing protein n=1 Tax=Desulfobacca sp. TaxID=2067990 RepID=UPI00404B8812